MAPMTNRVKVEKYFWGLLMATNNFAFEVRVILGLESTIPDGLPACRMDKLGIEPATAQLELGLGLSLAMKVNVYCHTKPQLTN